MKHILVVEDVQEYQLLVKQTLGSKFHLTFAPLVSEALTLIKNNSFDLILIDIMLPDDTGFSLCSQIRNSDGTQDTPIIFLTSKSDIKDKMMGFSLGADDYVVKPFEPLELRARVETKLNRYGQKKSKDEIYSLGDLKINIPYQKAFVTNETHDHDLSLTPNEFRLLFFFTKHQGHVLSRTQILDTLWQADTHVTDRTVDTHVYNLRKKLASKAHYIQSIQGVGYRFLIPTL